MDGVKKCIYFLIFVLLYSHSVKAGSQVTVCTSCGKNFNSKKRGIYIYIFKPFLLKTIHSLDFTQHVASCGVALFIGSGQSIDFGALDSTPKALISMVHVHTYTHTHTHARTHIYIN